MGSNLYRELKTKRLLLRKLKVTDCEMISFLHSDKEVNRFIERPSNKTKEEALEFISKINNGIDENNLFYWAITKRGIDDVIGTICYWNFSSDKKTAEIGFELSPKFQGKGIMSESLKSIVEFGFKKLNLNLIVGYTNENNRKSIRLLEKNGFRLKDHKKNDSNAGNVIYELKR